MTCFLIWRMGPVVVGLSSQRKGEEGGASVVMAKLPIPGCLQRGSGEVGRALAWPSTQAVHVALQSDSWCFALPFGRCHDLAAFSLCTVWELEHGGPEEKDIESFATPGSPHGWVNRSRVLLGVARFGRVCWLGSGVG